MSYSSTGKSTHLFLDSQANSVKGWNTYVLRIKGMVSYIFINSALSPGIFLSIQVKWD